MTSTGALQRQALVVHLETVVYPEPNRAGTVWRATVEHGDDFLVSAAVLQVLDPKADSTGQVAEVLGDAAAAPVGQVLCFCPVSTGDLIVADVNADSPQPDSVTLAVYAVQQALLALRSSAAHMTTDVIPVGQVQTVAFDRWECGASLTLRAAQEAGAAVEEAATGTRRGLRSVS